MKLQKLKFQFVVSKEYVVLIIQWLLPTNRKMLSKNTNSAGPVMHHGAGITIKVDDGFEIKEIILASVRIIVANVLLYGCSLRFMQWTITVFDSMNSSIAAVYLC